MAKVTGFRVVGSPFYRPAEFATARTYAQAESAIADMREGMVVAGDGRLVAFHERHLPTLERLGELTGGVAQ